MLLTLSSIRTASVVKLISAARQRQITTMPSTSCAGRAAQRLSSSAAQRLSPLGHDGIARNS